MTATGNTSGSALHLHVVTATGTTSGSTYMLWQLLGLLVVVLTSNDSYWDY